MGWLTFGSVSQAAPVSQPAEQIAGTLPFDIPAQPLSTALERYDNLTGLSVAYPSELAAGRISMALHGSYTVDEALRLLLQGAGLVARHTAPDAVVLELNESGNQQTDTSVPAESAADHVSHSYEGLVQNQVMDALCQHPAIAPGNYRLALRMQLDSAGRVVQARLLDTTGSRTRDMAILDSVQHIALDRAPADPSHPFVVLILPQPGASGQSCVAREN